MEIKLPSTLTAYYDQYDEDYERIDGPGRVVVKFGSTVVVVLTAAREHTPYYNGTLDEENEREIVEETVANWLREKLG